MNTTIGDQAAITFAASFYRAIGFGRSVRDAFEQGKVALLLEGIPEDATPKLLCKPGVDPAKVILVNELENHNNQDILLANLAVDEEECNWTTGYDGRSFYQNPRRPPYMAFVEINDFVVHFSKLDTEMQKMFEDVKIHLQMRLSKLNNAPVPSEYFDKFLQMDTLNFYKSLVLLNRLGSLDMLDKLRPVYDVRKEFLGERYEGDDFYVYDVIAIKAVRELLPLLWPAPDELENLLQSSRMGKSFKTFKHLFMRLNNPVFDITLVNNTAITQVLHRVEVLVEQVWVEIQAGAQAVPLRSIQVYNCKVDFSKQTNSFQLNPQISFGTEQPARFKIQFTDFPYKCTGNCADIRFRFMCKNIAVESETLTLSF